MRHGLGFLSVLAIGLVAMASVVAAWADDPAVSEAEKAKMKRWDQQFRESLDWYGVLRPGFPGADEAPGRDAVGQSDSRAEGGADPAPLGRRRSSRGPGERLSLAGNLIYECVSLARDKGLTAKEGGRSLDSRRRGRHLPRRPRLAEPGEKPGRPARPDEGDRRAVQGRDRRPNGGVEQREELRLLPKPIYRYDLAAVKDIHPDLVDGAMFAFVQGTDPEAVLMVEAVRRGDRTLWQYAFARATGWPVEAKLGPSVVWRSPNLPTWNNPKLPGFVLG